MRIKRTYGDESPVRVTFTPMASIDLTNVDSIALRVYDERNIETATLLTTLAGERRGFDPATYFPVGNGDGDWSGVRYYTIVLVRGVLESPLPEVNEWVQS